MPPRKRINRNEIVKSSLKLIRKGLSSISARTVAKEMGMSVVPIYSEFENMKKLEEEIIKTISEMLFSKKYQGKTPYLFLNIGVGYIKFATEERELFNWLFNSSIYRESQTELVLRPIINRTYSVVRGIDFFSQCKDNEVKEFVDNLWIYTHGLATLLNTEVINKMTEAELIGKLTLAFEGFDPRNKRSKK